MGIVGRTSFENNTLDKKNFSPHLGGTAFVNFRLFDLIALELGIGQHWNNSRFKDPSFERENEGFSMEMNNKNYYWNYYFAISGLYRWGSTDTYLYGKLGYSFNDYGARTAEDATSFAISRLNIDQTIRSRTTYASTTQSFLPELGIQYKLANRNIIYLGLKMNISAEDILEGSYSIEDNISGETTSDLFSSEGNFTTIGVGYHMLIHHIPKKEKVKRLLPPKKELVLDTIIEPEETPTEIADRKLVIERKLKVHSPKVTIMIWDHQTVDGDRVSLNFNGEWILEDYTLKGEKYSFEIELKEGINTFVLHALNLGKYEPNTAALLVKEGIKSHRIILESDLNESGTLEINYKKKKQ